MAASQERRAMWLSSETRGRRGGGRAGLCAATYHLANPRFALFGHSLGSAVAVELATEIRVMHPGLVVVLVLQSPFTSAREMARIVSTRPVQLLWKLIARVHYDSAPDSIGSTHQCGSHMVIATGSFQWQWGASYLRGRECPVSSSSCATRGITMSSTSVAMPTGDG